MVLAQNYAPHSSGAQPTKEHSPYSTDKKMPSFFHRPAKKNPAEQLAYAKKLEKKDKLRSAIGAYNDLVHRWHNSSEAIMAQHQIAVLYMKREKYTKAFKAFQYMIDHYAGNFDYDAALNYQTKIARTVLRDRWGDILFLPGLEAPERALPLFEKIIENAPNWGKTPEVRLKLGLTYESVKQYEEAIAAYDEVQQFHPFSKEAETALFRKAFCLYTLSKKAPRDEKLCRKALSALASFVARYKMSPYKDDAQKYLTELNLHLSEMYYARAEFYDKKNRNKSALIAYKDFLKKFPSSNRSKLVYQRVKVLEKELEQKKE
jgi:outer membrane assembly lipoprotein YfiO